jgi:predicted glycosyltransferase involved in capsule biosynthesis
MEKISLKDTTFLMPVRFDSVVRLENAVAVISFLRKYFDTRIIVLEASPYNNHIFSALINKKIEYYHIEDHDIIFHKTRYTNILAQKVTTPLLSVWDADVIADKKQIMDAVERLRNDEADMAYPYDGSCYDTPETIRNLYLVKPNIRILDKYMNYMYLIYGNNATGGAVFIKTDKFYQAGMDNEDFYGWGSEDTERLLRFENLGYKIYRSSGPLYHLSHPRDLNGMFRSENQHKKTLDMLKKIQDNLPVVNGNKRINELATTNP